MRSQSFPKDFFWGASTASHQVEGGTVNQWSEWERLHAPELAASATKRLGWLPNWKQIELPAKNPDNYIAGSGVDHYTRYIEDFDLLKQLNMNAFRFSFEWSRIEPSEGSWDEAAIEHYRTYITELKRRGIEPIPTLWHWTVPVWFAEKGGFEKKRNLRYFLRFVRKIAEEYGTSARYMLTLNEPNVYVMNSYITGEWPPQHKNLIIGIRVYWHLVLAHRQAYELLKQVKPSLIVGCVPHLTANVPKRSRSTLSKVVVASVDYIWNWWYLDRIRNHSDIIAVNYYFKSYFDGLSIKNPAGPLSDLGWYMEPSGISHVLNATWRRYNRPLMITENGCADSADVSRKWWIEETITAIHESMQDGVVLIGYLHWSLLDNFEWAFGWWPQFGLIVVDRSTMARQIRPSARWFAAQIKNRRQT